MKKYLRSGLTAVFLAVTLFLSAISAWAATTYTEGYFNYIIEDESITITYYKGSASEVTVPNSLVGYPVSKLAAGSFSKCTTLRKLNLPDTIVEIEEGALPQGITVVYDSNTDTPQNSGVEEEETKEDTKKENNTVTSDNNTAFDKGTDTAKDNTSNTASDKSTDKTTDKPTNKETDKTTDEPTDKETDTTTDNTSDKPSDKETDKISGTTSDSVQEEEFGYSSVEVEITDEITIGESSGINLDELNASVKETEGTKASKPQETSEQEQKEAVSDENKDTASNEKTEDASEEEANTKADTNKAEKTSDSKKVSEKEETKENSQSEVLIVVLCVVAIALATYFKKKTKK